MECTERITVEGIIREIANDLATLAVKPAATECKDALAFTSTDFHVCPICCEVSVNANDVICPEEYAGAFHSACSCAACATCWKKWIDAALPQCRREFTLRVQCYGCPKYLPQGLVLKVAGPEALTLAENLERRSHLQRNVLFPECMQVECRKAECVGIGYLGYETIMCMICEEQWSAVEEGATASHEGAYDMSEADAFMALANGEIGEYKTADGKKVTMRKCPKCGVIIEKNGGCDHMNCKLCKHEFYWSTGKAYR